MSAFAKGKLIFTVNSLNNLYGIDERELLLNCLTSLNNNVYNITGFRVPELGREMYQRDLQELRNTLFKGYIRKIKDTQHDLTDLILNDIFNMYKPRLTETYNMFISGTFYGGGDPPPLISILSMPSRASRTSLTNLEKKEFRLNKASIKTQRPPIRPPSSKVSVVSQASRTSATSISRDIEDERRIYLANRYLLEPLLDIYPIAIYTKDKEEFLNTLKQKFPNQSIPSNTIENVRQELITNILSTEDENTQKDIRNDLDYLINTIRNYISIISGECGIKMFNNLINELNKMKDIPNWAYNFKILRSITDILDDYVQIDTSSVMSNIIDYILFNLTEFNDAIFN